MGRRRRRRRGRTTRAPRQTKKSVSRRWRQKKSNAATRPVGRSSLKNALGGGEGGGGGERNLAKSVQEGFLPPSPNGLPDAVAPAEKKGRRDNPIISSAIWEERGWLELGRERGKKFSRRERLCPGGGGRFSSSSSCVLPRLLLPFSRSFCL